MTLRNSELRTQNSELRTQSSELDRPVIVENVQPSIDRGRFPIKRELGDTLEVSADIFAEGHGLLAAALEYRYAGEKAWREVPMQLVDNDRWQASFTLDSIGRCQYTVQAVQAVQAVPLPSQWERLGEGTPQATTYEPILEVVVERERARFAAWYELFPRSQGTTPGRSATFREALARLQDVAAMGFDVVYLPPIHPIGHTGRKGRNNTLDVKPGDPGSPWAIGDQTGGHKAVHPDLGTLDDFDAFVAEAERLGMEIALDYAIQCSPDHPYVKDHPDWFYRRPDGTIRYAENPPKKYQDIYPINFYCDDRQALWDELKSIVLFWISHGVKTFRVDNPHTKPFPFWEWLICEVQAQHPDVIFLAEAFTRPKIMKYLAKAGFSQSYTYFTWRNTPAELRAYLEELTQSEMREYFRGNLFANTPDILHEVLQQGGKPAFQMRLVLAATLSSVYGICSGFELLESTPLQAGSEEYLNSEKYEIKVWDWDRPGNIKDFVAKVNAIRRDNEALHHYQNLRFQGCDNANILAHAKARGDNVILVAANMDPFHPQEAAIMAPLDYLDVPDGQSYQAEELLTGQTETWTALWRHIRLDPAFNPAAIWRLTKT